MGWRLAADVTLLVHFAFILFVTFGALLLFRFPRMVWVHLPAAIWGTYVEVAGKICPLTILENRFRGAAGQSGYSESFIEHYIFPVIYPAGLTRTMQLTLGAALLVINLTVYACWLLRQRKTRNNRDSSAD